MTQDTQGVAQRVIDDMNRQRGRFETEIEHIAAVRAGGMQMLLDELSAEARTFLDELIENSEGWTNEYGPDVRAQCLHEVRQFCNRLGLDLEPEDSDE